MIWLLLYVLWFQSYSYAKFQGSTTHMTFMLMVFFYSSFIYNYRLEKLWYFQTRFIQLTKDSLCPVGYNVNITWIFWYIKNLQSHPLIETKFVVCSVQIFLITTFGIFKFFLCCFLWGMGSLKHSIWIYIKDTKINLANQLRIFSILRFWHCFFIIVLLY
jgi:hypothetical protein